MERRGRKDRLWEAVAEIKVRERRRDERGGIWMCEEECEGDGGESSGDGRQKLEGIQPNRQLKRS